MNKVAENVIVRKHANHVAMSLWQHECLLNLTKWTYLAYTTTQTNSNKVWTCQPSQRLTCCLFNLGDLV